ncbi:PREDICTED: alpha-L-arabinofuranosidase 2-like [Brassica oleracea var. oleracea]|uniref:alpha-L-arabinofuranosidase 2-like n=1 Tax=Brassica oleracea var. oleracea TaxID=109376 RepID=UPI0006A6DEB0|nr:PREDICTED: alpha-L-arabinofuranosidase 2-like [Brassica oleracea var. oleracea]
MQMYLAMMDMECSLKFLTSICMILFLLGSYAAYESVRLVDAREDNEKHYVTLQVDASNATGRPIPETLFGIFFEEINHAGAGGLWAELVSNRGFEAGGQIIPSSIWPWSIIGDESTISVVTDRSSCFERNKIALRMEVLCNSSGCPSEGVGVYNPGYWDLGAAPIWVFNSGISHNDQVETASIMPFVQEALDGIEFARGDANSTWGSVRAAMGHPKPFDLKYVAVGNEDCWQKYTYYKGNYLEFYNAIKKAYPDIKIISNCDGSSQPLDHPADYYDFHVYKLAKELFSMSHKFDKTSRDGPKAFVSEYAVNITDANTGNLLAALGEAGFLLGLEKNSDVVGMVSYAPLFLNTNDRRWIPDAIVFNSSHLYGTPSYWLQQFFTESSGATLLSSTMEGNSSYVEASAISFQSNGSDYIQIKAVNFANVTVELKVKMTGLDSKVSAKKKKVLTSASVMDENSFSNPEMIAPQETILVMPEGNLTFVLPPYSFSSLDLLKES